MKKTNEPALVLFSGGQDSTTCLAIAKKNHHLVTAICFNYGQRHSIEVEQAQKIAAMAEVTLKIMDISWLGQLTENSLTRPDMKIDTDSTTLPNTFVDGRNHIFLSIAAIYAKAQNIKTIYAGMCETDFSGYPDCRDVFVKSLNTTLNLAMDYPFEIKTPLMWLNKAETVLLMKETGFLEWYKETHTCYEGTRPACGVCPACKLRLKGFREAGIADPLEYTY